MRKCNSGLRPAFYINVGEIMNLYTSFIREDIFNNCYEKHMRTIYDAAERNGFKTGWEYNKLGIAS